MTEPYLTILAMTLAYCVGSLSSAVITCRIMNLPDPRTQGSGNPGATNVLRFGGKKAAIITLICDILKGLIPVLIAKSLHADTWVLSAVALAAFLGHLYPVFFKFQGGKGVATAFGCLVALAWPVGLALLLTWLVMAVVFRYSSLAALVASLLAPVYAWYFTDGTVTKMVAILSVFLIVRHRKNILNLVTGKEDKIGKKKINI